MLYCATVAKSGNVEKLDINGSEFLNYFPTLNTLKINEQLRIVGYSIMDTHDGKIVIANRDSHRDVVLNALAFFPTEIQNYPNRE